MPTILVPIDYAADSLKALEVALGLALRSGAQVLLCHVYQPPVLVSDKHEPVFALPEYETRSEALRKLKKFARLVRKNAHAEVPVKYTVRAGDVVQELAGLIRARGVQLVVMGTRGGRSFLSRLFGTNTQELVQRAQCPVLVVPEGAETDTMSRMVYASGLEPAEADALHLLVQLKKLFQASLTLLYVDQEGLVEPINIAVRKSELLHPYTEEDVAFAQVRSHHVPEGIAQFVQQAHADVLAFTVDRHGFWSDVLHQSVSRHLLQELQLPMLALPKQGSAVALALRAEGLSQVP